MNGASGVWVSTIVTSCVDPSARGLGVVGVADGDVQPGQALVELDGRRHRARDEAEDAGQPRRDHLGREPQRQGVRHVAVDDGREGEEQVAIGVGRGAADVIEDAGKRRDPALRVGGDHGPSGAPNPRRGCPLYPEHPRPGRVIRGAMAGGGHTCDGCSKSIAAMPGCGWIGCSWRGCRTPPGCRARASRRGSARAGSRSTACRRRARRSASARGRRSRSICPSRRRGSTSPKRGRSRCSTRTTRSSPSTSRPAWSCTRRAGYPSGTLMNALLAHLAHPGGSGRVHLVHRLDRETSGIVLVAKSPAVHATLARAMARRAVHKDYLAVVYGTPRAPRDRIDLRIRRDPATRRMTTSRHDGLPASTEIARSCDVAPGSAPG